MVMVELSSVVKKNSMNFERGESFVICNRDNNSLSFPFSPDVFRVVSASYDSLAYLVGRSQDRFRVQFCDNEKGMQKKFESYYNSCFVIGDEICTSSNGITFPAKNTGSRGRSGTSSHVNFSPFCPPVARFVSGFLLKFHLSMFWVRSLPH